MGHKVHPKIYRTNIIFNWDSRYFGHPRKISHSVQDDFKIREFLRSKGVDAGIDSIIIERSPKEMQITIIAARPGVLIGRAGKGIEDLQKALERSILKFKQKVRINVQEIENPSLSATIVAQGVKSELERRLPFRRVLKQAVIRVMQAGGVGVKIKVGGRLNGADIARAETISKGKLPLATLRSNIDYAQAEAYTTYGVIGIKVWICKGELFEMLDPLKEKK